MFRLFFTGYLGATPRYSTNERGVDYCTFDVAVRRGADQPPLWIACACFGHTAAQMSEQGADVGSRVVVSCTRVPSVMQHVGRDGEVSHKLHIVADYIEASFIRSRDVS